MFKIQAMGPEAASPISQESQICLQAEWDTKESIVLIQALMEYAKKNSLSFINALKELIKRHKPYKGITLSGTGDLKLMVEIIRDNAGEEEYDVVGNSEEFSILGQDACCKALERYLYLNHYSVYCLENIWGQFGAKLDNYSPYSIYYLEKERNRLEANLGQIKGEIKRLMPTTNEAKQSRRTSLVRSLSLKVRSFNGNK